MRIYFATWLMEKAQGDSLTKRKANTRLLSYHFIREQGINLDQFSLYMVSGRLDARKRKT